MTNLISGETQTSFLMRYISAEVVTQTFCPVFCWIVFSSLVIKVLYVVSQLCALRQVRHTCRDVSSHSVSCPVTPLRVFSDKQRLLILM